MILYPKLLWILHFINKNMNGTPSEIKTDSSNNANDYLMIDKQMYYKNKHNFICIEANTGNAFTNIFEFNDSVILKDGTFIANIDIQKPCNVYYEIKIINRDNNINYSHTRIGWIMNGRVSNEWVHVHNIFN